MFSGKDVSGANIEYQTILRNGTSVSASTLILGDDTRFFQAGSFISANNIQITTATAFQDEDGHPTCRANEIETIFDVGAARIQGSVDVRRHLVLSVQIAPRISFRIVEQEPETAKTGERSGPSLNADLVATPRTNRTASLTLSVRTMPLPLPEHVGGARVFGAAYERDIYPLRHSRYHLYLTLFTILSIVAASLFVLNLALIWVGNYVVHKMLGLRPPLDAKQTYDFIKDRIRTKTKQTKVEKTKSRLHQFSVGRTLVAVSDRRKKWFSTASEENVLSLGLQKDATIFGGWWNLSNPE